MYLQRLQSEQIGHSSGDFKWVLPFWRDLVEKFQYEWMGCGDVM